MPNEGSSSAGARPKKRRSWPRYSLRMLMAFMLMCALFFGYVAITLKRHKDQWGREHDVIARLEEVKARGVVIESQKPRWLQYLLPKAYDKYFDRVTKLVIINSPPFNEADLGRLKTLSHLRDLRFRGYRPIPPTSPGVTDEEWEAFFKEMPALHRTAEQRMLSFLSKKPKRPQGTFVGPLPPSHLIEFLADAHDVEFLRVEDELEHSDVLVIYDDGLSLTDNFSHRLGEQLEYRIAPPWLWLIKGTSPPHATEVAADGPSVVQRDLSPFTREEAVSRLQKLGCAFEVDQQQPDEPIVMIHATCGQFTDEDVARLRGMTELQRLALRKTAVTDAGLIYLKDFPELQGLSIASPFITDAGIAHLEGLTSLEVLAIEGRQFGNASLAYLRGMKNLERLWITDARIDAAGFKCLEGLTKIQSLRLSSRTADGSVLRHIKNWVGLTELQLNGVNLDDEDLKHIEHLTELTVLDLSSTKLKGPGLACLRNMAKLEELDLYFVRVADESLAHLSHLESLRILRLCHSGITDAGLENLKKLTNLEELDLAWTEVTGAGLVHLQQMGGLKRLILRGTKTGDGDLQMLKGMTQLEKLDLRETAVTAEAIDGLRTVFPATEIQR